MGFSNAQIATDIGRIFTSLSANGANEEITHVPSEGTNDTFSVIRAKTLSARDLEHVGWARQYTLSVYATNADGSAVVLGDVFTFATEGDLRVLNVSRGPTLGYIRFDMGDKWSGTA